MSRIKSQDTKPELLVRKFLHKNGFRYRLHVKDLPGKPDIVLPKYKTLIFVHGCFWHGHQNCKFFKPPKSNQDYWIEKINKNINRDKKHKRVLKQDKWKVITIWECDLKKEKEVLILNTLLKKVAGNTWK